MRFCCVAFFALRKYFFTVFVFFDLFVYIWGLENYDRVRATIILPKVLIT